MGIRYDLILLARFLITNEMEDAWKVAPHCLASLFVEKYTMRSTDNTAVSHYGKYYGMPESGEDELCAPYESCLHLMSFDNFNFSRKAHLTKDRYRACQDYVSF